eukprot:CAMPEP_0206147394 /NCGR_PEP_ID=MMETSP1473-20131121/33307_1 /ASSEMBLY_ACC=CAM_ASM_001109 /TAXON_ID=1461547 /ORGANISM="Stichococcus sp, Strain RCC1054" /LENGTH=259 /DNA_ID=CAMNT_0053544303 /DNA_START=125 /DNA_END=905 /DNA_ORIENTATION=-
MLRTARGPQTPGSHPTPRMQSSAHRRRVPAMQAKSSVQRQHPAALRDQPGRGIWAHTCETSNPTNPDDLWLIVGLGNPGREYVGTRHNVGFACIDHLGEFGGISVSSKQNKAIVGRGTLFGQKVVLAKPQTFMNLSGDSVGALMRYYKVNRDHLIVLFDDLDTELGKARAQPQGSHNGHNGMRSIIQHLRNERDFPRIRIGIGRPPGQMPPAAWVLKKFSSADEEQLWTTFAQLEDKVETILEGRLVPTQVQGKRKGPR